MIRERTNAGLAAAREHGRVGGRPRKLSDSDIAKAKAMLKDPNIKVKDVAATLGVDPSTVYRTIGRQDDVETDV